MTTKVAILDDYHQLGLSIGDWNSLPDCEVTVFSDHLYTPQELIERLKPFDVVCAMRERTAFPRVVFENLPNLKLIIVTAGLHSRVFDWDAALDHGVMCCRTDPDLPRPDGSKRPGTMMEITFGLMIACTRHLVEADRAVRAGKWHVPLAQRLGDLTLGMVGFGSIGSRVAAIGHAFQMPMIAWSQNMTPDRTDPFGVKCVSREELFKTADVISVQLRLSDRTEGLIGTSDFRMMKKTAYFINTSRGGIVREKELVHALQEGWIAGAGLDVFEVEPLPMDSPLRQMENVVLTPHLGYATKPQFEVYYTQFVECIKAWKAGKPIRKLKDRAPGESRSTGFWIDEDDVTEQKR